MSSRPISYGAYCVVTVVQAQIVHVGIYSSPAAGLTTTSKETFLDGPKVENEPSFAVAHKHLLQVLREFHSYRWLYDMLPERDRS